MAKIIDKLKPPEPRKFSKEELENSKRITKSATPKYTIDWYIKWVSSFIILIGMALTSINLTPFNLYFHFVGVVGWLIVGLMWHDRALMVVNSVAAMILLMGILRYYFGGSYQVYYKNLTLPKSHNV